jgi:hypothetical protein
MYSSFIRILLALLGLSPVLLSLYMVKIIRCINRLSIYFKVNNLKDLLNGLLEIIELHSLLLLFFLAAFLARLIVTNAQKKLPIGRIAIKAIKPGDTNFFPLLFSVILPFYKFYNPAVGDIMYMACFVFIAIVYGMTMKNSYHFNLVLKLLLGYNHYEVTTSGEITYLLLSKEKLVNRG